MPKGLCTRGGGYQLVNSLLGKEDCLLQPPHGTPSPCALSRVYDCPIEFLDRPPQLRATMSLPSCRLRLPAVWHCVRNKARFTGLIFLLSRAPPTLAQVALRPLQFSTRKER